MESDRPKCKQYTRTYTYTETTKKMKEALVTVRDSVRDIAKISVFKNQWRSQHVPRRKSRAIRAIIWSAFCFLDQGFAKHFSSQVMRLTAADPATRWTLERLRLVNGDKWPPNGSILVDHSWVYSLCPCLKMLWISRHTSNSEMDVGNPAVKVSNSEKETPLVTPKTYSSLVFFPSQ